MAQAAQQMVAEGEGHSKLDDSIDEGVLLQLVDEVLVVVSGRDVEDGTGSNACGGSREGEKGKRMDSRLVSGCAGHAEDSSGAALGQVPLIVSLSPFLLLLLFAPCCAACAVPLHTSTSALRHSCKPCMPWQPSPSFCSTAPAFPPPQLGLVPGGPSLRSLHHQPPPSQLQDME